MMGRSRGSIVGLMAIVSYVAAVLAAFRSGSEGWVSFHVDLTFGLLLLASIRARFARDDAAREWWFGFALFGWAFLLLASGPFEQDSGTFRITTVYRKLAYEGFVPFPYFQDLSPFPREFYPHSDANHEANRVYGQKFIKIFRCSCVVAFAYLGAHALGLLAHRMRSRRETHPDPSSYPGPLP